MFTPSVTLNAGSIMLAIQFVTWGLGIHLLRICDLSAGCTVPSLETDRWKYYNCIIPESCSTLRFFLFVCMCLELVLTKLQHSEPWTLFLRGFLMYSSKVQISLFEQQKLTSLNIRIASFLRVAAPCGFVCLSLCVSCWYWQNFSNLRLKLFVWVALEDTAQHQCAKINLVNSRNWPV